MEVRYKINKLSSKDWDNYLISLKGHPLQSALWGNAREKTDKIKSQYWAAFVNNKPILLIRFEVRKIPFVGNIAWIPKGPVGTKHSLVPKAYNYFLSYLKKKRYLLCIQEPYFDNIIQSPINTKKPQTILINLNLGEEKLWSKLDKTTRWCIKVSKQRGIAIKETKKDEDITSFFHLYEEISKHKKFSLQGSEALIKTLIQKSDNKRLNAKLFVAHYKGKIAAGALVLRSGDSLHYFWGTTNRKFSQKYPGEALQWEIINWAIKNKIKTYDLEGIDPKKNQGVYHFKKKFGKEEVTLPGKSSYPLNLKGKIALMAGRLLRKI